MEVKQIGNIMPSKWGEQTNQGRVYDTSGLSPTLNTMQGGGRQPYVVVKEPTLVGGLGEKKSNGGAQYYQQDRVYSSDGLAMCHPSSIPGGSYRYLVDVKDKSE